MIDYNAPNSHADERHWFVTLTEDGSAKIAAFTKSHIGKRISVTCDGQEIQRAAVAASSPVVSRSFRKVGNNCIRLR